RLADIYLTYAEAAYELSSVSDYNTVPEGGTMTAAGAVDIVRTRAGMPVVAATLADYNYLIPESEEQAYEGSVDPFRVLYRNERAVEFAYEGQYWYDIRRWKIAHFKDGTPIEVLKFNLVGGGNADVANPVDDASIVRLKAPDSGNFVFKDAHYWMPFLDNDVFFAESWEQNPGW
ncbi:RagB/SusD family nutrient uptake outer membrane protein, partial [Bacteroidota bacterium]